MSNEVENDEYTSISEAYNIVSSTPSVTKKDPKKVEQGKRLAAISREAKERKMREKIEAEYNARKISYSSYVISYAVPIASAFGVFSFF